MNILIINGSPRKKGLISQMLSIMQEEAEKHGDTVEMVYTNDLTLEHPVQAIARRHPCYARNRTLCRLQNRKHHRARRHSHASRTYRER